MIRLLEAIVPEGDDVLILEARTFSGQLDIDVMQGRKAKTMGRAAPDAPDTGGSNSGNVKQLGLLAFDGYCENCRL